MVEFDLKYLTQLYFILALLFVIKLYNIERVIRYLRYTHVWRRLFKWREEIALL